MVIASSVWERSAGVISSPWLAAAAGSVAPLDEQPATTANKQAANVLPVFLS
jgi:hypothetical protein